MKLLTRMAIWAYLMTWAASSIVYHLVGHPDQSLKSREMINATTDIMCAFQCRSRLCTSFSFKDGLCRMYNTGEGAVTPPSSNLAVYKGYKLQRVYIASVTGSSLFYDNPAYDEQRAIDGDMTTMFHSDNLDMEPWLSLELMEPVMVHTVRIFPNFKHQTHISRFNNIEVRVGMNPPNGADATMNPLFGFFAGPYDNSSCCSVDFTPAAPVEGRYVHIRRYPDRSDETLIIVEVQIFA